MERARLWLTAWLVAGLVVLGMPAPLRAEMVGTAQALAASDRAAQEAAAQQFLARADVQQELERFGVAPADAAERVAALTDAELTQLSQTIAEAPAGADGVIAVIGIVFLVLLILELVGVTDVFKAI